MKLSQQDFETLQDGLDLLFENGEKLEKKEKENHIKRVEEAENALIAIGTY